MKIPTAAVAITGLFLGIAVSSTPMVIADSPTHIVIVPVWMPDAKTPQPANLPGDRRVVGISCVPKPLKAAPDAATCYVATSLD
jgi:hypothetical protein